MYCHAYGQVYSVGLDGCSEPLSLDEPHKIETGCEYIYPIPYSLISHSLISCL